MRHARPSRRPIVGALTLALTATVAVAALAAPVAAAPAPGRYEVAAGDTLSELAETLGTSVAALATANGIDDPDHVVAGTVLDVPEARTSGAATSPVPASRQHLDAVFDRWANANGISPSLLKALCWNESGWQADVVSSAGADGVCQLMPDTEDHMEALIGRELDSSDAEDSIRLGARYLRWLLARTGGDVRAAVGSYYQGLGAMERHGPYGETVAYVDTVLALQGRF